MKRLVHVYTGDGKGKTTAALGLILRAVSAGMRVYFGQFLKNARSCENKTLRERFREVDVKCFGTGSFVRGKPSSREIKAANAGLAHIRKAMVSREYDLVIADEINNAVALGLLSVCDVLDAMEERPPTVELVLTGRSAPPEICEQADIVTEMRKIKHCYDKGVPARPGIDR